MSEQTAMMAVRLHFNRFQKGRSASAPLIILKVMMTDFPVPTASSMEIIETALDALRKIYKPNRQYKKAAVILHGLKNAEAVQSQGILFETHEGRNADRRTMERQLMNVLDRINHQHGQGTVFFGGEGIQKDWRSRQNIVVPLLYDLLERIASNEVIARTVLRNAP